jgi:1,4-dihydroxy-2-naphthoyl-CoA hydrolase
MPKTTNHTSAEDLNRASEGKLPGHLGLVVTEVADGRLAGRLEVRADLVAHTGYLLAGALLSCLDILCAYGVSTAWPDGANGFTTVEVKSNFVGTVTEGAVLFEAELLHGGRLTQVWDARARAKRAES